MRAAGDQANTVCGNLQLCTGLEAGIEDATTSVGQRRLGMVRVRCLEEEETEVSGEEEKEEEGGGAEDQLKNLTIETVGTAEEVAEGLEVALGMATQEMEVEVEDGRGSEGEDAGGGRTTALLCPSSL